MVIPCVTSHIGESLNRKWTSGRHGLKTSEARRTSVPWSFAGDRETHVLLLLRGRKAHGYALLEELEALGVPVREPGGSIGFSASWRGPI